MATSPDPFRFDAYELAKRIAEHLTGPERWIPNARRSPDGQRLYGDATLTRASDGAELSLAVRIYRKSPRLTVCACWPSYQDGSLCCPRKRLAISRQASRPPAVLARAIERDVLAVYEPAYRLALHRARERNAASCEAWLTAQRIARAIGAELPGADRRMRCNGEPIPLSGGPSALFALRIDQGHGDRPARATFGVRGLDEQTALRVIALVAASHAA